jgi:hypothetical protein
MNRLSPLITRRVGPMAPALPWPGLAPEPARDGAKAYEDLKLFATGWLGGLVFFGTLFA